MKRIIVPIVLLCLISLVGCGGPETEVEESTGVPETVATEPEAAELETEEPESAETETAEEEAEEVEVPAMESGGPSATPERVKTPPPPKKPVRSEKSEYEPEPEPEPEPETELEPEPEPVKPAPTDSTPKVEEKPATDRERSKLPKNHTVDKDGVMHAPGLENPAKKCGVCHGKDLKGGKAEVSCFDCHDQNWE